jgi:exodeoxyribonuclease VII small subunit
MMAKTAEPSTLSFEAALARLEEIVHSLETGSASLEDSITLYTEGVSLRAACDAKLKDAQARIEKLQISASGAVTGSAPLDSDAP